MDFKYKRIIIVLALVLVIAVSSTMCVSAASKSMEKQDFDLFTMKVPKDVDLQFFAGDENNGLYTLLYLNNNSKTYDDVYWLDVWYADSFSKIPAVGNKFKLINKSGDTNIYKYAKGGKKVYWVEKNFKKDGFSFGVMGQDLKTLKKMSSSIKINKF